MEESPRNEAVPTTTISRRKKRRDAGDGDGDGDDRRSPGGGELMECSGAYCKSCTGGLIADCVALCCCGPCALLKILAFALVKVPYMVGRRCLGVGKRKEKMLVMNRKCKKVVVDQEGNNNPDEDFAVPERNVSNGNNNNNLMMIEGSGSTTIDEADKIWLGLHQIDHLHFGRVSFTGIDH